MLLFLELIFIISPSPTTFIFALAGQETGFGSLKVEEWWKSGSINPRIKHKSIRKTRALQYLTAITV